MRKFTPTKPQWSLAIKPGPAAKWVTVGVGWDTDRGGISVRMDEQTNPRDFLTMLGASGGRFMLFPKDDDEERRPAPVARPLASVGQPEPDYMESKRRQPATAKPPVDAPAPASDDDLDNWT